MKDKDHLENPPNVLFADLLKICEKYFGKPEDTWESLHFHDALER